MDVRVGPERRLSTEELMLLNCGWRRLLRVPWTATRSNQSVLKKINPEYSLEGLMLKLKLQYFGHLMRRASSLEKTQMTGKVEGKRGRGQQRVRWLGGIADSVGADLSNLQERVKGKDVCCAEVHGATESRARLGDSSIGLLHSLSPSS